MNTFLRIFCTVFLLTLTEKVSGQTYTALNGHVYFHVPALIQNIEAHSKQLGGAIRLPDQTFAFSIPIASFEFERAFMQQHFNEHYLETEKFPSATFAGKLLDTINLANPGTHAVRAAGKFTLHGVTRETVINGIIISGKNRFILETTFPLKITDYNIKIPRLLFESIAETVQVKINMVLRPTEQ